MKYAQYMVDAKRHIAALDHVLELTVLLHDDMTESLARMGLTTSRALLLWELHQGPMFIAAVELWVAGRTDPALGNEVAKFESIVVSSLITAVAEFVPDEIHKPMLDFLYTAMDALRGILVASFVDSDPIES